MPRPATERRKQKADRGRSRQYRKWQEAALLLKAARTGHEAALEQFRVTTNRFTEQAALIRDLLQAQARSTEAASSTSRDFPRIGPRWPTCAARWEMSDVKTMTLALLAPLSAALLMTGCSTAKAVAQAPQAVQKQRVGSESAASGGGGLRYSAIVEPEAEIRLSFRIPGYVVALKQVRGEDGRMRDIAEGDRVGKGSVLVRIRAAEYEDKVRQATSQAAAAEALARRRSSISIAPRACTVVRA